MTASRSFSAKYSSSGRQCSSQGLTGEPNRQKLNPRSRGLHAFVRLLSAAALPWAHTDRRHLLSM